LSVEVFRFSYRDLKRRRTEMTGMAREWGNNGGLLIAAVTFTVLCFFSTPVNAVDWDVITELDDYVNRVDTNYAWSVIETYDYPEYILTNLNLTSQKWMDETFSDSPIWWHYLSVYIPKNLLIRDAGYIFIGGGNHDDPPPNPEEDRMLRTAAFAVETGAVSAVLRMVPFQPILFANSSSTRVEDEIIGYTWNVYITDPNEEPNPDVVVLLPMTKAAKTALDAITEFTSQQDPTIQLVKFMPHGYSKRGWTTWLLGCVDRRVFAMVPTVFDLLNMVPNLEHHYRALGGWSWAFLPYWVEDVSRYLYHPRTAEMATFIDPLSFNERLTIPKLVITAAGDQFFPPDGANFFYQALNQPTYLQVWQNDDHNLDTHWDAIDHNLRAFFLTAYRGLSYPQFSWTRQEDETTGTIIVTTSTPPLSITSWWADTTDITCEPEMNNTCRRDFRITTLDGESGIWWNEEPVQEIDINTFGATFLKRDDFGYRIFFIELTFPGPDAYTFRFTTDVQIIPDTYPYPKCETEEECKGRIV
jgi:PhoPQ-activated pathogenicity-related protein